MSPVRQFSSNILVGGIVGLAVVAIVVEGQVSAAVANNPVDFAGIFLASGGFYASALSLIQMDMHSE